MVSQIFAMCLAAKLPPATALFLGDIIVNEMLLCAEPGPVKGPYHFGLPFNIKF